MPPIVPTDPGLHLRRVEEPDTDALVDRLMARGAVRRPVEDLVVDLDRRGRRALLPLPAIRRAWTWDATDRRDPRWWPQGVTTSADADPSGLVGGRRVVVVAWYAKPRPGDPEGGQGVRVSFFDPDLARYRHVLLVRAVRVDDAVVARPLRAHAGGLVWAGRHLHVAATARGFWTCHLDDLLHLPAGGDGTDDHFGYADVLPVRAAHRATTVEGVEPLRYSFLSLDRTCDPPELLVGEYGRGSRSRRLAHYDLEPGTLALRTGADGVSRPRVHEGVAGMQGAVTVDGRYVITASRGPWRPGSVWSGRAGDLREHRWATPMGPEDLARSTRADELWTATEHPRRRWICVLAADRFR